DLACGLSGVAAPGLLLLIGVGTDQRGQIAEQQLIGYQAAGEAWPGLSCHIGQVTMNVAVADTSGEIPIVIGGAILALQLSAELAGGGIRRRVRQGYSGARIELTPAGPGQLQLQVPRAQIPWLGQRTAYLDACWTGTYVRFQWKRLIGILKRQNAASLAFSLHLLPLITSAGSPGEGMLGRAGCLRRSDQLVELHGFAQGLDMRLQPQFADRVVNGDLPLIKSYGAYIQNPG